ncbi:transposase [uncultured Selenomonas sp.]|uniref:transposase n=1 Tax=uncultured Selenomonas sp. TaxID=159275 RepID=UPI0037DCC52B
MKYTKEQRLDIGRRIYDGELTRYEAAEEYEISDETARNYMRQYRNANRLPPKRGCTDENLNWSASLQEVRSRSARDIFRSSI